MSGCRQVYPILSACAPWEDDEGGKLTGNTVTAEEEGRWVLQVPIRQDGLGLVVTKVRFRVSVDDLPFVSLLFGVSVEDVIGDDVDRVDVLGRQEVVQDSTDRGHHTASPVSAPSHTHNHGAKAS